MQRLFTVVVAGSFLVAGALAQTSEVNQREKNQQERIANGVKDGQLTAGETQRLERKEAGIKNQIHQDRAANGGRLTGQEKTQINREDNRLSQKIYSDKHNNTKPAFGNNEIGQRRENQQDRIANGIASGRLTPGEASRMEGQEKSLNREIGTQRALNGGRLTGAEKRADNQQLNRQSQRIFRNKHNRRKGY